MNRAELQHNAWRYRVEQQHSCFAFRIARDEAMGSSHTNAHALPDHGLLDLWQAACGKRMQQKHLISHTQRRAQADASRSAAGCGQKTWRTAAIMAMSELSLFTADPTPTPDAPAASAKGAVTELLTPYRHTRAHQRAHVITAALHKTHTHKTPRTLLSHTHKTLLSHKHMDMAI